MGLVGWFCICLVAVHAVAEDWSHCTVLDTDGKYHVCWKVSLFEDGQGEIVFGVDVQANGYVGFGLSPNGGMAGSDIVTGWVRDGQTYFQDRHGVGNMMPEMDESTDWYLIRGSENDTHTSMTFQRKLDTCDYQDMKIDDSTIRLIYAYSKTDPKSENQIHYHEARRGAKSVLLLQQNRRIEFPVDKSRLDHWDILSPNFTISSEFSTMYWCKIYKAPPVSVKHHIVTVEPWIQNGNEGYVHHILVYECVGATAEEYESLSNQKGHECYHPNMPDSMKKCEGVSMAWAIGGEDLFLPDHVGIPMEPGSSKYYMMEMHYDNPFKHNGIIDNSGFRVYYTPDLRKFDAGVMMFGTTVSQKSFIPPQQKDYVITGHSNAMCLDPVMPKEGLKFLGIFLHSHLIGRRLQARHFRQKTELQPLADDNNYDFNYQEYRYFPEEVEFLHGDQVTLECTYDSSKREKTTFGGESTKEEMCLAFVLYYPKVPRYGSTSLPTLKNINMLFGKNWTENDVETEILHNYLVDFDWTSIDYDKVQRTLRDEEQDTHCYIGNGKQSSVKAISYPENFEPYRERQSCVRGFGSGSQSLRQYISGGIIIQLFFGVLLAFHIFSKRF